MIGGLQRIYHLSLRHAWRNFEKASRSPAALQSSLLLKLMQKNASTQIGRRFHFDRIKSIAAFREQVPITDYDFYEPFMERIAQGETNVLFSDPIKMFERSGGATSTNKMIPYNQSLFDEFGAGTQPWIFDLYRGYPGLFGTKSYWSISPIVRKTETTSSGIPIGIESDTEYFGPFARWFFEKTLAVPSHVAKLPTLAEWKTETLVALANEPELGLFSIWNPSFLTLLMQDLEKRWDEILERLEPGRRRFLESARNSNEGVLTGETLWPRLQVISCWTDGVAAEFLPALRKWFPKTAIQAKGLLATEGVISFPLCGHEGGVLAVGSHFLEFQELDNPKTNGQTVLAHELEMGKRYSPLLTTGGGLTRYCLKDIIRCVGHFNETPMIRFMEKQDMISDLCGEKISASQVDHAFGRVREQLGLNYSFAILASKWEANGPPHYHLYIETDVPNSRIEEAATIIEEYLLTGHHYQYCRNLGQLAPLSWQRVTEGARGFQETLANLGLRLGDIKPSHLARPNLAEHLSKRFC